MSQKGNIIGHWSAHKEEKLQSESIISGASTLTKGEQALHSLTQSTGATKNRRKSFGMNDSAELHAASMTIGTGSYDMPPSNSMAEDSGYMSDPTGVSKRNTVREISSPDKEKFEQMQEDPRYSIYHPRYRIPEKTFGFSKPFARRSFKSDKTTKDVPLFDKYVKRMRDGFEKIPQRGTFSRASKGLQAEWYPMDYADLEAVRRQGYFHETIGDIKKFSHKDFRNGGSKASHIHHGEGIYDGTVLVSPKNKKRRASIVQHESRQYKFDQGRTAAHDEDTYSQYKKWYPSNTSDLGTSSTTTSISHTPFYNNEQVASNSHHDIPKMSLNISLDTSSSISSSTGRQQQPTVTPGTEQNDESKKLEAYLAWLETQNTSAGNVEHEQEEAHPRHMSALFGTTE